VSDMDADIDATNPNTQDRALTLAGALDSTARILVPIGHGLKPGMTLTFSQDIGGPRMVTSVTATTIVIRNLTRRERLAAWLREVRYRAVRLWWRAWDAVAGRVA